MENNLFLLLLYKIIVKRPVILNVFVDEFPDFTIVPSIVETLYFQDVDVLSVIVTVASLSVTLVTVILVSVTAQDLVQSPLIQAFESIVCLIRSPGCGPKPFAKLIPTELTKWQ
jgi:hypothetical protein